MTLQIWCQLIAEFGVGVTVFVRCFVDQKAMEHLITEKLGLGFSRPPFAAVVVSILKENTGLFCFLSMLSFRLELAFSFCRLFVQLSRYWL